MQRRRFLEAGLMVGAAVTTARVGAQAPSPAKTAAVPAFDLDEVTVDDLQARMQSGALTAKALAEKYLARIEAVDRQGPALNSVIEVNPDALALAETADEERRAGKVRGPLHGIPVLVKDNIDSADRMMTTAGSLALLNVAPPVRDATVVARLREAGAVLLGKTNLSEWANFRSARSTSGWSARGGLTRNPYALDRNTSGSSAGSGAAASANLAALTVGTETDGSIVSPSSICGLVGLKPTVGLVSRAGIIPISASQDTAGPMTRTVRDAAYLLAALAGMDPRDKATAALAKRPAVDYVRGLDPSGLKGARIGVVRKWAGFSDRVDRVFAEALAALRNLGATVVDPVALPTAASPGEAEFEVMLHEFKAGISDYLAERGAPNGFRTLKDLIDFNDRERATELRYFGQDLFRDAWARGGLTSAKYVAASQKAKSASRALGLDAMLTAHRLDALVGPSDGPAWLSDLLAGDHYPGATITTLPAVAGYPHVTVPMGAVAGLPVGLSFVGPAWSEARLLRFAFAFEQATKHRTPPAFPPTVPVDAISAV